MNNLTGFIDEWGNNELDFSKNSQNDQFVSTHFIITAFVIRKEDTQEVERVISAIKKRHFGSDDFLFEGIGADLALRKLVLEDLSEAPFQIFALIVDKRQVISEGLRYKGSFYKFLHKRFDEELFHFFPDLQMIAGPVNDESFIAGFIKYVQQNHISNLFNESSFGFINHENKLLTQASGLISGTLAYCYDEGMIAEERSQLLELLQPKLISIKFWPDIVNPNVLMPDPEAVDYDKKVAELSINLANDFLHRKAGIPVPHVIDQITTLSYLLFHFRHINAIRYISSFEIMQHIKVRRGKPVSLHYFQTKVIAPLRDAGVLIASSAKGYKLPASETDLYDFINHSNAIIEPMLSRVKKFRDQIMLATNDELDLLEKEEYSQIRKVVD